MSYSDDRSGDLRVEALRKDPVLWQVFELGESCLKLLPAWRDRVPAAHLALSLPAGPAGWRGRVH